MLVGVVETHNTRTLNKFTFSAFTRVGKEVRVLMVSINRNYFKFNVLYVCLKFLN